MISFFRKLRQRLLAQNRVSSYLFYALGEILLVVIGILIALQIDTWNEARKNRSTEQHHLVDIHTSLKRDKGRTQYLYNGRARRKSDALQALLGYLHADSVVADTTLRKAFFTSLMTLTFSYDKGGYESLKSFGLDKISSDTFRPKLVRFYEVTLPMAKVFLEEAEPLEKARREGLLEELRTFTFKRSADSTWYPASVIDFANLKEQEAFKELIWMEMDIASNYEQRLESILRDFDIMIDEVAAEIQPNL